MGVLVRMLTPSFEDSLSLSIKIGQKALYIKIGQKALYGMVFGPLNSESFEGLGFGDLGHGCEGMPNVSESSTEIKRS